jgi:DNA-binding response OmpR family regulator
MGAQTLSLDTIAVRLADEGVPLRAIARAVSISSETLRNHLREARLNGILFELPRDDWPPGFPRDQRALQLSRMASENHEAFVVAIQHLFGMTPTGVKLLLTLIQQPSLLKHSHLHLMSATTFDVHICAMRKALEKHNIRIETLWGHGYQLPSDDRQRIMDLILARLSPP